MASLNAAVPVDLVESEVATDGQAVTGLLICDVTTVELPPRILDAGFDYLTLSAIGYRDHLYRRDGLNRLVERADPTSPLA